MLRWLKSWFARRREAVLFEAAVVVELAGGSLTATYPDGLAQTVSWETLERVEIFTNDRGPWEADVWWVFTGPDGSYSFPQGATGERELLPKFQQLPGFDNKALIRAMGCSSNRVFLCWQRR